jgi:hypothetical protein
MRDIWGKSVIPPKPHEDSSIEATNKFAEEIELRRKSIKNIPIFRTYKKTSSKNLLKNKKNTIHTITNA